MPKKISAFTLPEVLLSIALFAMVAALSTPIVQTYLYRNELEDATYLLQRSLRTAEMLSQAAKNDARWGVRVTTGQITVFQGNSYAARVTASDRNYPISSKVNLSGTTEVVFTKLSGELSSAATINLSHGNNTDSITINEKGRISI